MRPHLLAIPLLLVASTCAAAQLPTGNSRPPEPPLEPVDSVVRERSLPGRAMAAPVAAPVEAPSAASAATEAMSEEEAALSAALDALARLEAEEAAPLALLDGERLREVPAGRTFTLTPSGAGAHPAGDAEFAGHGPEMRMRARLRLTPDARQLWLELSLEAKEIRRDWTQVRGKSTPAGSWVLLTADPGFRIKSFSPSEEDWWRTVDVGPAAERFLPREAHLGLPPYARFFGDVLAQLRRDSSPGALVQEWVATGDVRGADVGRTGVKVTLRKVQVVMAPEGR